MKRLTPNETQKEYTNEVLTCKKEITMGQYAYLINKKQRIYIEAYKISTSGNIDLSIEEEKLPYFLEHCRENRLIIECVSEHWFDENVNLETDKPYNYFNEPHQNYNLCLPARKE